ncbi:hypothetical protein Tco_1167891 [Tanacetum coccineum]
MEEVQNHPRLELSFAFLLRDDGMSCVVVVIWRRPKAITPDEPIEEPDNSLNATRVCIILNAAINDAPKGIVRIADFLTNMLKMTNPANICHSGLFSVRHIHEVSHFFLLIRSDRIRSLTPTDLLLYLAPPGVKIRSLTPASSLRAGGISSGWHFHDYPDFEDSRAHGFVHSYIRASYPQLHLGDPIS